MSATTSPALLTPRSGVSFGGGGASSDDEIEVVEVAGLLAQPWKSPQEEELPTNVSSVKQLAGLPPECLSNDALRPLRHEDDQGVQYSYHLNPMSFSVIFILLVELLERFSFYGINYTQTLYLTGDYDWDWNAGMSSVAASTYVSISVAIAYTSPFLGAFSADYLLGDYYSILFGALGLYLPGLILIALTTIPGLLGEKFNTSMLKLGFLGLWPIGTGVVKSIVNVFGAKQFHPLLQSSLIESFYVNFYMCINVGALLGGIMIPIVAQHSITIAYFIPVCMLAIGVVLFLSGTTRYVRSKPKNPDVIFDMICPSRRKRRKKKHRPLVVQQQSSKSVASGIWTIFRISLLIIPFNIAYAQMATTFIVQGTVMKKGFGVIDAATMNNADAISVLISGYVIGGILYPALARHNIKIPTTYKFAIGSAFGALAIGCALIAEYKIHSTYKTTGEPVSILWQAWPYSFIGIGEIFAVSSAYEVAFMASPPNQKGLASAVNLFCVGGIPNYLCIGLYSFGGRWFKNSQGNLNIAHLNDYATAHVGRYFLLLFFIALTGVGINLLPCVRDWVASIEDDAAEALKTPITTPLIGKGRKPVRRHFDEEDLDEAANLLKTQEHRNYLKYGTGPALYKNGSFRAGAMVYSTQQQSKPKKPPRYVKYGHGLTLFKPLPGGGVQQVMRADVDAKSERGILALEKALEGKDMDDPQVSTSTL